jgi:hypothetical protein
MMSRFRGDRHADREYQYIAGWAARRARKYHVANAILGVAIERYTDDPRFFHGRSLNTYSWLKDSSARRRCPYTLKRAIVDGERAVELYEASGDPTYEELTAACYNNLAYFYSVGDATSMAAAAPAREALLKLKALVPSNLWNPKYPEYFHTEACVEYCEAMEAKQRSDVSSQSSKLAWARSAIEAAIRLKADDSDYPLLRVKILDEIRQMNIAVDDYYSSPRGAPESS